MAIKRYARTPILGFGTSYGTSRAAAIIREHINLGEIKFKEDVLRGNERLDTIAGREYGDSSLYWIIAAASNIGWCLQAPPGTSLKIPNIDDVAKFIG